MFFDLSYIYQLPKFGDFMSSGSKDIFQNTPCANTYRGVTDSVNHEMVKHTKT